MSLARIKRLAQLKQLNVSIDPSALQTQPDSLSDNNLIPEVKPSFDVASAQSYNTKSKLLYQKYDADIKRLLNTSAEWESPEFAQAVYDWQGKNGFNGKWIDGKLGPATMGKMAQMDSSIKQSYDAYSALKSKHANDKPYPKVLSLMGRVQSIQQQMNATDIPLGMLMGWM